jgi:hypothetical protein
MIILVPLSSIYVIPSLGFELCHYFDFCFSSFVLFTSSLANLSGMVVGAKSALRLGRFLTLNPFLAVTP